MTKENNLDFSSILFSIDSNKFCNGEEPIGGKGKRTIKRKSKKTGLCPMCGSSNCKLTYSDFFKTYKSKNK